MAIGNRNPKVSILALCLAQAVRAATITHIFPFIAARRFDGPDDAALANSPQ